jgi:hypothetical protein
MIMSDQRLDPRPELRLDHTCWEMLLEVALSRSDSRGEPYHTLEGFRCLGARLTPAAGSGLRLQRGEIVAQEYEGLRARYLEPQLVRLQAKFREAAECLAQEALEPAPAA